MMRWAWPLLVALAVPSVVVAQAAPVAPHATLDLTPPVTVTAAHGSGHVVISLNVAGGAVTAYSLADATRIDDITAETVTVTAQGAKLGLVHVAGDVRTLLVVAMRAGAPAVVFSGREDFRGDPGERTRVRATTVDRTKDGIADVVVFTEREDVWRCGAAEAWQSAQAWDPKAARFRPVHVSVPPPAKATDVQASTAAPPGLEATAPRVANLQWDGAASSTGDFLSGRWLGGPNRIRALRWDRAADRNAAAFWITFSDGTAVHVSAPAGAPSAWVVMPAPVRTACVSLLPDGKATLRPAEFAAFSDMDFAGGTRALLRAVMTSGDGADEAAQALREAPATVAREAVTELTTRWPDLSPGAKLRSVPIFAAHGAASALVTAAEDQNDDVSAAAIAAIGHDTPAAEGVTSLLTLLRRSVASQPGTRTALLLAAIAEIAAAPEVADYVRGAQADETPAVAARLALAFAKRPATAPLGAALLRETHGRATDFDDVYRLLHTAALSPDDATVDAWLLTVAKRGDPWMLRVAAAEALLARRHPEATAIATAALTDPQPRVRQWALTAAAPSTQALATASRDPWAFVRITAIGVMATSADPNTAAPLLHAVTDHTASVRAAAIEALTARTDVPADAAVTARVTADDEDGPVVEAAARYAAARCATGMEDALVRRLATARSAAQRDTDDDLAAMLTHTLGRLGGPAARRALAAIAKDAPSEAERSLAARALAEKSTCQTAAAPR